MTILTMAQLVGHFLWIEAKNLTIPQVYSVSKDQTSYHVLTCFSFFNTKHRCNMFFTSYPLFEQENTIGH